MTEDVTISYESYRKIQKALKNVDDEHGFDAKAYILKDAKGKEYISIPGTGLQLRRGRRQ